MTQPGTTGCHGVARERRAGRRPTDRSSARLLPAMATVRSILGKACAAAFVLSLAACGAGLIGGIASSTGGGGSESTTPELSLAPLLPLVPAPNTIRTVVVANAQIAVLARLRVRLDAAGTGVDQTTPIASGQGGSTLISFALDTAPIVAALGDPTAADVAGTLSVFVDDRPIAPPVPVLLARQPRAELDLVPGQTERFMAPFGERVRLRVTGLRSDVSGLQVFVRTVDETVPADPVHGRPTVTRLCTDLRPEPTTGNVPIVSAVVPGNAVPVQARLFVRDGLAGESTVVTNAYYRPDIAVALPSQGPTTGGSLVTLIGTALVPPDLAVASGPAPLAFGDVEISFRKGERVSMLPIEDFRIAESGSDRLVFVMPASPDGRPGQVDIVLRARLGSVTAEVTASQVFLFANPKPFFGPRGVVLSKAPVAVVPLFLDAEPGTEATAVPDFAVLTDQGGVGFLQLMLAQRNGMFQPFAAPRQIGDPEVAEERNPRDICSGDFDGDGVPDMFLANSGTTSAVHHLVLGRARPATPLGGVHRIAGIAAARCRSAQFDGDGIADVLLLPAAGSGQGPVVLLARPTAAGPAFAQPIDVPVRPLGHDAAEIADLDGDGHLDIALLKGATLQVDVAWGIGDGTFTGGVSAQFDFSFAGYTPDPESGAVGLHACRDGPQQSLGFVLSGLPIGSPGAVDTQAAIGILPQPVARQFVPPLPSTTVLAGTEPFGQSLVADLDGAPPVELVVSVAGIPSFISLAVLRFTPDGWLAVEGGVETGAELPRQITALHFGRAFAPEPNTPEASAVFVVHESLVDGLAEKRLSTRLVFAAGPALRLLPPDAGAIIVSDVGGIVGGDFHPVAVAGAGQVRDLAVGQPGGIQLVENDGYGGFPRPTSRLVWPGLLPASVALLSSPAGEFDRLVFANADARLGVWKHDPLATQHTVTSTSAPLSTLVPSATGLTGASRLRVQDVDGDGIDDLVVLMHVAGVPAGEDGAGIALLRGKASPGASEFPFHEPTGVTLVHSNASAIVLADFAPSADGPVRLELALAVPVGSSPGAIDGDHVRFYRYEPGSGPADDRFVRSAIPTEAQVLLAGGAPTQLAAADFDRDGLVDLLVADAGDAALRLIRNVAPPRPGQPEVDIAAFVESPSSPLPTAPGTPTALHLTDVNGDGNVDAVAVIEFVSVTSVRSTSLAFYLSTGTGELGLPQFVSPLRLGDRDRSLASDIGDFNRDGVPDLLLAWPSLQADDRNVRVLFGGTR